MIHIAVTRMIDAQAEKVYNIFTDYKVGHAAILPKPYFQEMIIEKGGKGAGTQLTVQMKVFGVEKTYHLTVSEPDPGRVLMERDDQEGVVTRFIVEPAGNQSKVTIDMEVRPAPGFMGVMEKWMNPPITRHILKKELQKLQDYVQAN